MTWNVFLGVSCLSSPAPTFLKNRASDPVRRGRPLPVWRSEVVSAAVARLGEAMRPGEVVSKNWALMVPEESHGWTGISVIVRSLCIPADIHTNTISNNQCPIMCFTCTCYQVGGSNECAALQSDTNTATVGDLILWACFLNVFAENWPVNTL